MKDNVLKYTQKRGDFYENQNITCCQSSENQENNIHEKNNKKEKCFMFAEQISIDKITTVDLTNLRTVPEETRFFLCQGGCHLLRTALEMSNIPDNEYKFYSHKDAINKLGIKEENFPIIYYPYSTTPSRHTIVLVSHIDLNDLTKLMHELEK